MANQPITDASRATTDYVFALCHLLGYRFVPRRRDLADKRLATIEPARAYSGLEPIIGRPIRTDAIVDGWPDIIRLAASIKAGSVAPSTMLKMLSAYKRQNRPDLAHAEVGRIERTLFSFDCLENKDLRGRCQAGLNKGEACHALAETIYAHRQGRFADRTLETRSTALRGSTWSSRRSPIGTRSTSIGLSTICAAATSPCPTRCSPTSRRWACRMSASRATTCRKRSIRCRVAATVP